MKRLICLALCAALLCGCQLARPGQEKNTGADQLVGVFVTEQALDLFDVESYLQEHPEDFLDGELEPRESGKLYALRKSDETFEFPGVKGMYLCNYYNGQTYIGFNTEGMGDVHSSFADTEAGRSVEESATIRIVLDGDLSLYSNPIYQTADGRFYVTAGNGMQVSGGGVMAQTLSEESTVTEAGESKTYAASFRVRMECIEIPDTVTLVQMSEDNRELARLECIPGQMPEKVEAVAGTAYIILENTMGDTVTRTLHQSEDDSVLTWYKSETPVCLPQYTEVIWP